MIDGPPKGPDRAPVADELPDSFVLDRAGARLAGLALGEGSPAVLLLHGLAGYGGEWIGTMRHLGGSHRVVAPDTRGHGGSERSPADPSLAARVADAAFLIERLDLPPCVVVGQSMGGIAAMSLAARRPDLVRALVVVEAVPLAPDEDGVARIGRWLEGWPVPFADRDAAVEFFSGPGPRAEAWAAGLEQRDDGLWPRFDPGVLVRSLEESAGGSYWQDWGAIACPTLVVLGEHGSQPEGAVARMVGSSPGGVEVLTVPRAGHDLHLEEPAEWLDLLTRFLAGL